MELELLFPKHLRASMERLKEIEDLEEIRVRIGQPLFLCTSMAEFVLQKEDNFFAIVEFDKIGKDKEDWKGERGEKIGVWNKGNVYYITEADVREMQNYISNYSLYAWQDELRNGFLTVSGGHRIGLCGSTRNTNGRITGISYISGLNIRIAHEKKGCAEWVLNYIRRGEMDIYNTLIASAPGVGKTTLLRDCMRLLSYGGGQYKGKKVGIVDERSEIAACYHGIPQNDVGPRTDVLDGGNKPEGIVMLLRTMSPEVIGVDELGAKEDYEAVEHAVYCGCRMIGTVHARNEKELREKIIIQGWGEKEIFERFIIIEKGEEGKRNLHIYDNRWTKLY